MNGLPSVSAYVRSANTLSENTNTLSLSIEALRTGRNKNQLPNRRHRQHAAGGTAHVPALLVPANEELARAKFVRIHGVQQTLFARLLIEIRAVELGRHLTPHLNALDSGNIPGC